jgi:GNAT superfamily N-acetyltransferase
MADLEGQAAGWIHAVVADYVDVEPFVVIAGLVVDARMRRQGVGRMLMTDAEAWARQQGFSAVHLTSSSTRTAAHRFYESIGYTNIKTQYSFAKLLDTAAPVALESFVRAWTDPSRSRQCGCLIGGS